MKLSCIQCKKVDVKSNFLHCMQFQDLKCRYLIWVFCVPGPTFGFSVELINVLILVGVIEHLKDRGIQLQRLFPNPTVLKYLLVSKSTDKSYRVPLNRRTIYQNGTNFEKHDKKSRNALLNIST